MDDSIIDLLSRQDVWEEFLAYRLLKGRLDWTEFERADDFVEYEEYLPLARQLAKGGGLGIPEKKIINKMGTGKKRTVYVFSDIEMTLLKLIAHLLYRYDGCFSSGCYAFRKGVRLSDAVLSLHRAVGKQRMWAYKVDIHDYFNSISVPLLLNMLKDILAADPKLYAFFEHLLTDGRAIHKGTVIAEQRGAMAGTPTASFMANVYLRDLDFHFVDKGVIYARYSDDIILFAKSKQDLDGYRNELLDYLNKLHLEVNPSKEMVYSPDDAWEFLGFKCLGDSIDISESTKRKLKGKIYRKSRALLRWRDRKGVDADSAMRTMIRIFNRKFFDDGGNSLTWSRWFFPVVNCTDGFAEIDRYLQQNIRFLSTGKHSKSNFRVRYSHLKNLGYRSLVHEYYIYKSSQASN